MEIKSLDKIEFDTIFKAFSEAFSNYEIQLDKQELQTMLKRRGFTPHLSFAAFDKEQIVAFTLNGIGNFNGIPTAYDTGTGTLEQYRGKGLATGIFKYSIPHLRENNVQQYLLEVLQHNENAVSVYKNLGFEVVREFNYFVQKNEEIDNKILVSDTDFLIKAVKAEELTDVSDFWDFYPSWQNSFESVKRAADDFVYLGAFAQHKLAGYCIFEPVSGDVTQIAVDKNYRRKGIGSLLLKQLVELNKNSSVKIINTDVKCDSITAFLKAKNIEPIGRQFEMIKTIG